MADITIRDLDCGDGCDGERGKHGKRGKRGHDGPTNAGTGVVTASTSEAGRVGVDIATVISNVVPDRCRIDNIKGGPIATGGGKMYFFASLKMATVPDGTDNFSIRTLLSNVAASEDPTNGVYVELDRSTYGDNNWRGRTANGGVRTTIDLGVTPVNGTYQRLGAVVNAAATLATYLIDDVSRGTIATNIPTTGLSLISQIIKTLGTTARTVSLDYVYCAVLNAAGR